MICERCGAEFTPQNSETVCASCVGKALAAMRKSEVVKCVDCGVEFQRIITKRNNPKCRKCQGRERWHKWKSRQ